jgi:hypothetical protein
MPNQPQNQTLLELIYALKNLAQSVEHYHKDLSAQLEEVSNSRHRDLERLKELVVSHTQALATLPLALSDRVERMVTNLGDDLDDRFDVIIREVQVSVDDVRRRLADYTSVKEVPALNDGKSRLELGEDGSVSISFSSRLLRRLWQIGLVLAAGGGVYGTWQAIRVLFE